MKIRAQGRYINVHHRQKVSNDKCKKRRFTNRISILPLIQTIILPYLVQRVSRLKDDGREQQKEEHVGPKHFLFLQEEDIKMLITDHRNVNTTQVKQG